MPKALPAEACECESVGWVVHVDARYLSVAAARNTRPSGEEIGRIDRIPRGCVRRVTVLRKVR